MFNKIEIALLTIGIVSSFILATWLDNFIAQI